MDFMYAFLFIVLVIQIGLFTLLNVPTPHGWKGKITNFIANSPKLKTLIRVQMSICIIAAIFYYDSYRTEKRFLA